jgi:hypothetical protein
MRRKIVVVLKVVGIVLTAVAVGGLVVVACAALGPPEVGDTSKPVPTMKEELAFAFDFARFVGSDASLWEWYWRDAAQLRPPPEVDSAEAARHWGLSKFVNGCGSKLVGDLVVPLWNALFQFILVRLIAFVLVTAFVLRVIREIAFTP